MDTSDNITVNLETQCGNFPDAHMLQVIKLIVTNEIIATFYNFYL